MCSGIADSGSRASSGGIRVVGWKGSVVISLAVLLASLGCSAPQSPGATQNVGPAEPSTPTHTRISLAILGDPRTLSATMNTNGTGGQPGVEEVERLIHAGLAIRDD